jgi:hypothetical protein
VLTQTDTLPAGVQGTDFTPHEGARRWTQVLLLARASPRSSQGNGQRGRGRLTRVPGSGGLDTLAQTLNAEPEGAEDMQHFWSYAQRLMGVVGLHAFHA